MGHLLAQGKILNGGQSACLAFGEINALDFSSRTLSVQLSSTYQDFWSLQAHLLLITHEIPLNSHKISVPFKFSILAKIL